MQTKQTIERLLGSAGVSPNKRLGQHFLIDLNLIRLLIDKAKIRPGDVVVEVGPGTGSLTEGLAEVADRVISVEFDTTLAKIAQNQLKDKRNVTIIQGDALESKSVLNHEWTAAIAAAKEQLGGRVLLVANLPYNVSTPVMVNLITGPIRAAAMYVTVQKEVGLRMEAGPGGRDYGTMSILMAATGHVHVFHKLGPGVFWPRPAVDSAMVAYERDEKRAGQVKDILMLREVVGLFIGHRRKMLKACTKFTEGPLAKIHDWGRIFEESFVDPHCRAEEVEVEGFVSMANLCSQEVGPIRE